jgi:hypothetical protein
MSGTVFDVIVLLLILHFNMEPGTTPALQSLAGIFHFLFPHR